MDSRVYYLTGMGGKLSNGLGHAIMQRGWDVTGRELFGEFRNFTFQEQIDTVCDDLKNHFWDENARVICNSFGAYIFLHAQAKIGKPYLGKVLLLSSIVGEFSNKDTEMNFIPPRANLLMELATLGKFPSPTQCEIHVGENDWQANPINVSTFGKMVGIKVCIVPNAGHMLPKEYVGNLLDNWLN